MILTTEPSAYWQVVHLEEDNSSDWDSTTSMEDIKPAAPRPLSSKENSKIEESAFAFSMKQQNWF